MKRWAQFAALALFSCAAKPPVPTDTRVAQSGHVTLFVSAELKGYLGPCGCSENMRGGIARAAHQLEEARKKGDPVLYFDSGDSLFGEPKIDAAAMPQQQRKASALAASMKAMGLTLRTSGPLDYSGGDAFFQALDLPRMGPLGAALSDNRVAVVEAKSGPELAAKAKDWRNAGASFVVGLVRSDFEYALRVAADTEGAVDLLLAVRTKDELSGETNKMARVDAATVVQLQTKGRSTLAVDLYFQGGGRFELLRGADDIERETAVLDQRIELLRAQTNEPMISDELKGMRQQKLAELIARKEAVAMAPVAKPAGKNAWTLRFVPLESTFPEDPKVKALVTEYDRDVGLLNLAWAKNHPTPCPPPAKGEPAFVGNKECFDCHEEAFASWNPSKHAAGLKTLEHVGKQHHLDCISCHVTGWQKPGGVCGVDQAKGREGIGCESCHGPGSAHLEDPDNKKLSKGNTAEACTGCHDRENSPHFDFDRYLKEIIAPGHGLPAAKAPQPAKKKSG